MRKLIGLLMLWWVRLDLFWVNAHALASQSDLEYLVIVVGDQYYLIRNHGTGWALFHLPWGKGKVLSRAQVGGTTYEDLILEISLSVPTSVDTNLLTLLKRNVSSKAYIHSYSTFHTGTVEI